MAVAGKVVAVVGKVVAVVGKVVAVVGKVVAVVGRVATFWVVVKKAMVMENWELVVVMVVAG